MVPTSHVKNVNDADENTNDREVSSSSSDVANLKKRGKGKKKRNSLNSKTSISIKAITDVYCTTQGYWICLGSARKSIGVFDPHVCEAHGGNYVPALAS